MGNDMSTMNQSDPQPGDLIEIFRPGYQHWAVYIGDGFVVHLTSANHKGVGVRSSGSGAGNEKAIVKKDTLKDAAQGCRWKINNLLDNKYIPQDAFVIVKKALRLVGTELQYDLLSKNCEHFVTQLRYDKGESRQVKVGVAATVSSTVMVMALGVVAVVAAVIRQH